MTTESQSLIEVSASESRIPSCIEIGLQASKKGDFRMARQMLQTSMEQLENNAEKQPRLIELISCIADTYLNEGRHDLARTWYTKALQRSEILHSAATLQAACLMTRLAEISVLESNLGEFEKLFAKIQHTYLLSDETDATVLLNALVDLSWVLSVQGLLAEVQPVNELITQIKELEEEDRLFGTVQSVA